MVLLISEYKYPNGDAGSVRIHSFALTLQRIGYSPFVIGNGPITKGKCCIEGIPYISLRANNKYFGYITFPLRVLGSISSIRKQNKIEAIIVSHVRADLLVLLKLYCRLHNIKLIVDVVEWFSPFQLKHGEWSRVYLENELVNTKLITNRQRVIAISKYLEQYYNSKNIHTVRIPIYLNQSQINVEKTRDFNKIKFIYAGQFGKKDFLWLMLKAFSMLSDEMKNKIEFRIIGGSLQQVENICQEYSIPYNSIKQFIIAEGRLIRDQVLEAYSQCHYTILLRDNNERYAKAGFPTKIVESLSYGVPPVLNISSDLSLYLKDKENCIIAKNLDITSIISALENAINITPEAYQNMSEKAKQTAIDHFNIESYSEEMRSIFI